MANPKRRHSRSRRDKRRANWKLEEVSISKCPQCGADILQHTACSKCGFYDGKTAFIVKTKEKHSEPQVSTPEMEN